MVTPEIFDQKSTGKSNSGRYVSQGEIFFRQMSSPSAVHTYPTEHGVEIEHLEGAQTILIGFFTIFSFGFPTSITTTSNTVSLSVTHLNNQLYGNIKNLQFTFLIYITFCIAICINIDICIRRIKGYCYICYNPIQTTESATTQASWGIS